MVANGGQSPNKVTNSCGANRRPWSSIPNCLRESLSTGMSPYATRQDYTLDRPLGKWYQVKRDTKHTAYV
eukprot:scaffold24867_cov40-Cyclotella_meneghiniana.AAC.1